MKWEGRNGREGEGRSEIGRGGEERGGGRGEKRRGGIEVKGDGRLTRWRQTDAHCGGMLQDSG